MEAKVKLNSKTRRKQGMDKHKLNFKNKISRFVKDFNNSKYLLLLFLPCLIYFILFRYVPMWGVLVAFKDFQVFKGFAASKWVGFKYFTMFFKSPDAVIIIKNTLLLGLQTLLVTFPIPIIFALILNEVKSSKYKKLVQTVSYMPHFISQVIIVSMVMMFLSPTHGIVNTVIEALGGTKINFMVEAGWFRPLYIISEVWQGMGWGAIIYLAALTSVDPQLYEAAIIDGANRWKQTLYVTLPSIIPTIITMFLLRTGSILEVGFEKVLLMQNPAIYSTSDVISTFVYRQGLVSGNISYATAVGLFNSLVNLVFVLGANKLAKKYSDTSLW
ncbi:ABC transporter permease [Clostridium swellfunianum]|uniref:ABC transporter permease n=1 Tax=Clostridium swellfunianum TaxID=1367462 RepID=UPI00202FD1CB|nr:ABC transporter permease subunit [Clostridium swellfunianum]